MKPNYNKTKSKYDPKTKTYTGKIQKIKDRKNYTAKIKTNYHKKVLDNEAPNLDQIPDFYKEIFEEVDKEKQANETESTNQSDKFKNKPNRSNSRPNPFKRTVEQRERIQNEIKNQREEKEREIKERIQHKEEYEKTRKRQRSKLSQRGKKGQLILSNHIDHLLTKIQK